MHRLYSRLITTQGYFFFFFKQISVYCILTYLSLHHIVPDHPNQIPLDFRHTVDLCDPQIFYFNQAQLNICASKVCLAELLPTNRYTFRINCLAHNMERCYQLLR